MKYHRRNLEYGDTWRTLEQRPLENYLAVVMRMARIREVSAAESSAAIILADDLEVTEAARTRALMLADQQNIKLKELVECLESMAERLCLFRDTCRMAVADGDIELNEREFLDSLADALKIDQSLARQLFEDVTCQHRLQSRFLALLEEE